MNDNSIRILADSSIAPVVRHQLTRRGFMGVVAALGAAGVLTACSPGGSGRSRRSSPGSSASTR